MHYPDFYTKVPPIKLYDPLSEFLGAIEKGEMEISYLDCVKLAGHSCPTVAGAYLMAIKGLEHLYGTELPSRGDVKVELLASETDGVAGVIANVIAFIVGASGAGGFKGIQGNFTRNNLISYDTPMSGEVKLTRRDTQESVTLTYDPSSVPSDKRMQALMGKNIQGLASKEEKDTFGQLWQQRVEEILLNTPQYTQLITITKD
jgi:formylmethanofuran dehydrogenase subunit E